MVCKYQIEQSVSTIFTPLFFRTHCPVLNGRPKTVRGKFGLIVDNFVKNMELAIKPLPDSLAKLDMVRGVSILGNGNVLLVLDPDKIIQQRSMKTAM